VKVSQDIILKPLVTERATKLMEENKYVFVVQKKANKIEIKNAVEKLFKVNVQSVNTINMKGKFRRRGIRGGYRPDWKKAVVTLKEGSKSIEIFE
jgi:large subunit ribosomal protein L23